MAERTQSHTEPARNHDGHAAHGNDAHASHAADSGHEGDRANLIREFKQLTDTPAHIRQWIAPENEAVRHRASLDDDNEFHVASGRHHAERVLELLDKKAQDWSDDDTEFAGRVVNYAHRSAGISAHHPHDKADHHGEVSDTGMTKNEIARRNWGLPARPAA